MSYFSSCPFSAHEETLLSDLSEILVAAALEEDPLDLPDRQVILVSKMVATGGNGIRDAAIKTFQQLEKEGNPEQFPCERGRSFIALSMALHKRLKKSLTEELLDLMGFQSVLGKPPRVPFIPKKGKFVCQVKFSNTVVAELMGETIEDARVQANSFLRTPLVPVDWRVYCTRDVIEKAEGEGENWYEDKDGNRVIL